MTKFLEETNIIDYSNQEIQKLSKSLSSDCKTDIEIAKYFFVPTFQVGMHTQSPNSNKI